MWEFSWIERRWPGAGYEDWDRALDELVARGYDAVRIDPFPQPAGRRSSQDVDPQAALEHANVGIARRKPHRAHARALRLSGQVPRARLKVGLSTWYRQDDADTRMTITGPELLAPNWIKTLDLISQADTSIRSSTPISATNGRATTGRLL